MPDRGMKSANPYSDLWIFNYKRGNASFSGIVKASSEENAAKVARHVCEREGVLWLAGKVWPMVMGDESMLGMVNENPIPADLLTA